MINTRRLQKIPYWTPATLLGGAILLAGCGGSSGNSSMSGTGGGAPSGGPFQSLAAAANAPAAFTQPRGGTPLPGGAVAFLATVEGLPADETTTAGERIGVFVTAADGMTPTLVYSGDALVNPLDIDASLDGKLLYIADPAAGPDGQGAILTLATAGGDPSIAASGGAPRAVTVADDGKVYFSGIDQDTGDPGVFLLDGGSTSVVYKGSPLVDPSGLAVLPDGTVFVAEPRLMDAESSGAGRPIGSEAGVVRIEKSGTASVFATGFATGYPAGIALTRDGQHLIVSGEGPDRSDTVYIIDVGNPAAAPVVVTDVFSRFQDSSAGLKRAHGENTFIWASLAADQGTIYRIVGK
jgi:DNA-binding beta-propeller fold protein YncE